MENPQPSLDLIGSIMDSSKKTHLKIEGYLSGHKNLAKMRADGVKQYTITKYPEINSQRLRASATGRPEKIMVGWKTFNLNDSIAFH